MQNTSKPRPFILSSFAPAVAVAAVRRLKPSKLYSHVCFRIQLVPLGQPFKHAAPNATGSSRPPTGLERTHVNTRPHSDNPHRTRHPTRALLPRPVAVLPSSCPRAPFWLAGGRVAGVALVVVRVLHLLLLGELRTGRSIWLCDESIVSSWLIGTRGHWSRGWIVNTNGPWRGTGPGSAGSAR